MPTYQIDIKRFNKYTDKFENDVSKIPRDMKYRNNFNDKSDKNNRFYDKRYSYKNRRIVNKDWKDFNQSFQSS